MAVEPALRILARADPIAEKPGARMADAANLDHAALVEAERVSDNRTKRIGNLNSTRQAMRFHARGQVYGITPDVVGEPGVTNDAGRGAAGVQADAECETRAAQGRQIGLGLHDPQGELTDCDGLIAGVAGQAANVAIADRLDLLDAV